MPPQTGNLTLLAMYVLNYFWLFSSHSYTKTEVTPFEAVFNKMLYSSQRAFLKKRKGFLVKVVRYITLPSASLNRVRERRRVFLEGLIKTCVPCVKALQWGRAKWPSGHHQNTLKN